MVNSADPTGTTCEMTTGSKDHPRVSSCKIDDQKERAMMVKECGEKAVATLESAYKNTVNKLLDQGDKETTIRVDVTDDNGNPTGKTQTATVTARETAENLIKRQVGYNPASRRRDSGR